ncbi:NUDIX domain-containing protein [Klebsiella pneumoniae]|nr:NUDIX domain-containing protein [Klebsiella pneumoniae]
MQRRTETKDFHPGMPDATAGGVVQADEQLLESARREAEEELGIARVARLPITASFVTKTNSAASGEVCLASSPPGPFALQEEEVSEVCWLTPEEIRRPLR